MEVVKATQICCRSAKSHTHPERTGRRKECVIARGNNTTIIQPEVAATEAFPPSQSVRLSGGFLLNPANSKASLEVGVKQPQSQTLGAVVLGLNIR